MWGPVVECIQKEKKKTKKKPSPYDTRKNISVGTQIFFLRRNTWIPNKSLNKEQKLSIQASTTKTLTPELLMKTVSPKPLTVYHYCITSSPMSSKLHISIFLVNILPGCLKSATILIWPNHFVLTCSPCLTYHFLSYMTFLSTSCSTKPRSQAWFLI